MCIRDRGSTFWATVRLGKAMDATSTSLPDNSGLAEARLRRDHRGARILLVEDDLINQAVALHLLRAVSYTHLDVYKRQVQSGGVPAYTSVDLRYGWKLNRKFELAIVGQNLFDPLPLEFVSDLFPSMPAYQPRRAFVQATWRF